MPKVLVSTREIRRVNTNTPRPFSLIFGGSLAVSHCFLAFDRVRDDTGPSQAEVEGPTAAGGVARVERRGGGCGVTGTDFSDPPQVMSSSVWSCVREKAYRCVPAPPIGFHLEHPRLRLLQGWGKNAFFLEKVLEKRG